MEYEYQVTLFDKSNKYKPVSTIVKDTQILDDTTRTNILKKGAEKICMQRGWTSRDLKKYNYVIGKVRRYNKEKIAQEAAARYEKIKEEKYASGEWKRPKKKN